jgi:hypothetical protein
MSNGTLIVGPSVQNRDIAGSGPHVTVRQPAAGVRMTVEASDSVPPAATSAWLDRTSEGTRELTPDPPGPAPVRGGIRPSEDWVATILGLVLLLLVLAGVITKGMVP